MYSFELGYNKTCKMIWGMTWQNQQSDCAQWRSAQYDQSLHYALNGYLRSQAFFMRTAKMLIRQGVCRGWSESSLGAQPFIGFVVSWLICSPVKTHLRSLITLNEAFSGSPPPLWRQWRRVIRLADHLALPWAHMPFCTLCHAPACLGEGTAFKCL